MNTDTELRDRPGVSRRRFGFELFAGAVVAAVGVSSVPARGTGAEEKDVAATQKPSINDLEARAFKGASDGLAALRRAEALFQDQTPIPGSKSALHSGIDLERAKDLRDHFIPLLEGAVTVLEGRSTVGDKTGAALRAANALACVWDHHLYQRLQNINPRDPRIAGFQDAMHEVAVAQKALDSTQKDLERWISSTEVVRQARRDAQAPQGEEVEPGVFELARRVVSVFGLGGVTGMPALGGRARPLVVQLDEWAPNEGDKFYLLATDLDEALVASEEQHDKAHRELVNGLLGRSSINEEFWHENFLTGRGAFDGRGGCFLKAEPEVVTEILFRVNHIRKAEQRDPVELSVAEYINRKKALMLEAIRQKRFEVKEMPGALTFMQQTLHAQLMWGICTGSPLQLACAMRAAAGFSTPQVMVSADDLLKIDGNYNPGKPDPYSYNLCFELLQVKANGRGYPLIGKRGGRLAIEDQAKGAFAARLAGATCLLRSSLGRSAAEAEAELVSLEERRRRDGGKVYKLPPVVMLDPSRGWEQTLAKLIPHLGIKRN